MPRLTIIIAIALIAIISVYFVSSKTKKEPFASSKCFSCEQQDGLKYGSKCFSCEQQDRALSPLHDNKINVYGSKCLSCDK